MCYAQLLHAKMREDPEVWRFYQGVNERITDIASDLLFFTLELNLIEPDAMEAKLKAPALARHASWVRDTRAFRPHQLAEDMERLLNDKHVAGSSAWGDRKSVVEGKSVSVRVGLGGGRIMKKKKNKKPKIHKY